MNDIYPSLDVHDEKSAFMELPHRLDQEAYLESIFKVLGRKIIFCVFMGHLAALTRSR